MMDKKEARKVLGVSKETSRNDIERRFSILLKKQKMVHEHLDDEDEQEARVLQDAGVMQNAGVSQDVGAKQEEYSFEQVTQAYNILMGYEIPMKDEPPSKAAPLFQKAGIDEKKARNFFYYYKYHILAVIVAIISMVFIIKGCVNRVEPDFTTAFIGQISYSDTEILKEAIKSNIPEIKEPGFDGAFVSESDQSDQQYAMVMKATVLFAAGDVDVFILDKANFERYAKQGAFISLDEIAPRLGVDIEKNKEYIIKVEDTEDASENTSENTSGSTSANTSANNTTSKPVEEHLYGIDVTQSTALKESGIFGNEMIATLCIRDKQQDKAVKLLEFLMK